MQKITLCRLLQFIIVCLLGVRSVIMMLIATSCGAVWACYVMQYVYMQKNFVVCTVFLAVPCYTSLSGECMLIVCAKLQLVSLLHWCVIYTPELFIWSSTTEEHSCLVFIVVTFYMFLKFTYHYFCFFVIVYAKPFLFTLLSLLVVLTTTLFWNDAYNTCIIQKGLSYEAN